MSDKQRTAFDQWFDSELDPELNLTPGDKELCRHAWQAALSHAEGEASAPDYLMDALDNLEHDNYERGYRGAQNRQDDAELIRCALRRSHPAPQVAVPEALTKWADSAEPKDTEWNRGYEAARAWVAMQLAAPTAPTAPAGEPAEIPEIGSQWRHRNGNVYTVESITNESTERPGQYPVTVVYRGENEKLWSRPARDWHRSMTFESAPEQPVSDPDGLTEPGRREAEQAYINCAFDYARDPIGSRDWFLFWNGWRARNAAPAPDEREIAARPGYAGVTVWIGNQQCTQVVDRIVLETSRADELLRHFENARYLLRAGKEGEQS